MSRADDKRPDGRPWTNVRSTEELREAEARGWLMSQVEIDVEGIRDEALREAGVLEAGDAGVASPTQQPRGGHGWSAITARLRAEQEAAQ